MTDFKEFPCWEKIKSFFEKNVFENLTGSIYITNNKNMTECKVTFYPNCDVDFGPYIELEYNNGRGVTFDCNKYGYKKLLKYIKDFLDQPT